MANSATIESGGLNQLQVLQSLSHVLQHSLLGFVQDESESSTEQGALLARLPVDQQAKLKQLAFAAFDRTSGSPKDVGAFVQLVEAIQPVLVEHWSSLSPEVQAELVAFSEATLNVISNAATGRSINSIELSSEPLQKRVVRLLPYLRTSWTLFKNPFRAYDHLKQLLVVLPQFARTIQRLHDHDRKVAQFQQKLAESKWDRTEQIQRNQAAIALIRARIQQDEQMSEAEDNQSKAEFELFKQIIDANRPAGSKLYSNE